MKPPKVSLDDTGTRYSHYRELLGLWEWGLSHIESKKYIGEDDRRKIDRLTAGVFLLRTQLDLLSGYDDARITLRRELNEIPVDPEHIPGGRGTPLV